MPQIVEMMFPVVRQQQNCSSLLAREIVTTVTLADAIMDRVIHNAHRLELEGDTMRKIKNRVGLSDTPP